MSHPTKQHIYYADTPQQTIDQTVSGEYVSMLNENYYRIRNYDALAPFFMTLISNSNHWLFVSTTGGCSAGRIDRNHALFPYYTDDKITENSENTGSKTLLLVTIGERHLLWEPFSSRYRGIYRLERNIYKNVSGTSILFEEVNHDLGLTYRYAWRTSEQFGFVKTAFLINEREAACDIEILDGLQNILPAHVASDVQNTFSNLLDAYKFAELHPDSGLGLFSLSSRLTDLAEPSESLRTNTIWQIGLNDVTHLLSASQLDQFRSGYPIEPENYIRGRRGAYFVHANLRLEPGAERQWHFVAEVDQDSTAVVALLNTLQADEAHLIASIEADIRSNQQKLIRIIAEADGLQVSSDPLSTAHHFANVLFNVMRGGIFANHYQIDTADLRRYVAVHHPALLTDHAAFFAALPQNLALTDLRARIQEAESPDLQRICYSYLPLTFSRRHGDPSRPWNFFQINVKQANGSQRLDYQGNWRDIFQNWEALSYAYPQFITGMIRVFVNATTPDGYNPYRMTRDGIDWEIPEPDNPWANIGYWSDHQIIYLQKLLEVCHQFFPDELQSLLNQRIFSHADVPYRIKPYADLIQDPYNTIEFDWEKEEAIRERVAAVGADGKLVPAADGGVLHVSLAEKLLMLLLAKLVNFVPEGGIWMNTQRPEWNDANNALVGKGLSVVTLSYMRRYVAFLIQLLEASPNNSITVSQDVMGLLETIHKILQKHHALLHESIDDEQRRLIMDELGTAGSDYRERYYEQGASSEMRAAANADVLAFLRLAQEYIDHSLRANERDDKLYHAYNVLHLREHSARVGHLYEMLEGQVAILSSGLLPPDKALALIQAMRESALYRADQHSYMLYPDRSLPTFLEKNVISPEAVASSKLVAALLEDNDTRLISQDVVGNYHFQGDIRNAADVKRVLAELARDDRYTDLVPAETDFILDLFEQVFDHDAFTGRSGTFFAFEGLGSIYWHMVSKLLLAVQENVLASLDSSATEEITSALQASYEDVRAGIGFNKSPQVYGAFPTDPYSHTPAAQGAKQPGMTGMVKEEILTRIAEFGLIIEDGTIRFYPAIFREQEALAEQATFTYIDLQGNTQHLDVPPGAVAYTFCQVPFVVLAGDQMQFKVHRADGTTETIDGERLPTDISQHIFARDEAIQWVTVSYPAT